MKTHRITAVEIAVASIVAGAVGLCVLIIPSPYSAPISAALAMIGLALAAVAYRSSEDGSGARSASKVGALLGVVVIFDIVLGLGIMW